jgi:hypothetical protein
MPGEPIVDNDFHKGFAMSMLLLFPVIFSCLLLAAHFLHAGLFPLILLALAMPPLLLVRRRWVARLVQIFLVLGALEWMRTMGELVQQRQENQLPWTRLAIILSTVALFTLASVATFGAPRLRLRYFAAA